MTKQQQLNDLIEIQKIFKESFDSLYEYDDSNKHSQKQSYLQSNPLNILSKPNDNYYRGPTIINNNYGSTIPLIIPQYHPIILNQGVKSSQLISKKKSEKKELSRGEIVASTGAIVGILSVGTYLMSKDEYVTFYLSQIDENIKLLNSYYPSYLKEYEKWKSFYQKRTSGKCHAKLLGTGSLATSVGGFMILSNVALFGGLVSGTACGCYLLWKYLTDNIRKEKESYIRLRENIDKKIKELNKVNLEPSAPSLPEQSVLPALSEQSVLPPAYNEIYKE